MTEKQFTIVGIGEILWDLLPTGKHLGGAPANFAFISNQLGNRSIVLSCVGNDEFGKEIVDELKNKNISHEFIQIDEKNPTGIVKVLLENGQPSYEIVENVAWDFLELSENWRDIAEKCDAVCFGSLAQRNDISQKTIRSFVGLTKGLRIFDVNLRQNFYSKEILRESLNLANVVKLNHEELPIVAEFFGIESSNQIDSARNLLDIFNLKTICVTRGGNGSLMLNKEKISEHKGLKVEIADTIGAGDAFTAGMTFGILNNWELENINEFANKVGAFVASRTGAMPSFTDFC